MRVIGALFFVSNGGGSIRRRRHVCGQSTFSSDDVQVLASSTLALLEDDLVGAKVAFASRTRSEVFEHLFGDEATMSPQSASTLFESLAIEIVKELALETSAAGAAAGRLLESRLELDRVVSKIASKLLAVAGDGEVSRDDLKHVFDAICSDAHPLDDVAGTLQILPKHLRKTGGDEDGQSSSKSWHADTPGDAHVLKQWVGPGFSIVGIGRSADASAYYVPELDLVFDAGLSVKSLQPKTVLLTHGHRDHTQALPSLARRVRFGKDAMKTTKVLLPEEIETLARRFVQAEAALNYGQHQTDEETDKALGPLNFCPVAPGDRILLSKEIGVRVYRATHKPGVPAVAYGVFRPKKRLRPAFIGASAEYIKAHRDEVIETYDQGLLFYSGDSTAEMLSTKNPDILRDYKIIIHECTFLGEPDDPELEASCAKSGHTHFAQIFPMVCAYPETTFVLVHFSTRYSPQDVVDFFDEQYGGRPKNVVLWI